MTVFFSYQDSGLDDWEPTKNYVQMGYRPGFAVQARELTQMQTAIQNQISVMMKRFIGNANSSIIDASLTLTSPSSGIGNWQVGLGTGYVYIVPPGKKIGYFVHNNTQKNLSALVQSDQKTYVYAIIEEVQVNPEGSVFPQQGGYSRVAVDDTLVDNAQGFYNYNAPGASRYQINITGLGYYLEGSQAPVNTVDLFYITPTQDATGGAIPYYSDTNQAIPY